MSKNHIPTTPEFREALAPLEYAVKVAEQQYKDATMDKCLLIQGYLLAHGVSTGSWDLLPDGSAIVMKPPEPEAGTA